MASSGNGQGAACRNVETYSIHNLATLPSHNAEKEARSFYRNTCICSACIDTTNIPVPMREIKVVARHEWDDNDI
eukprot:scaffold125075_cov36-Prasinocladus_malaysianus.AAC.1